MVEIIDEILQTFRFYISIIEYLDKGISYFINITNAPNLIAKSVINNFGQVVIDFEKK